MRKLRFLFTLSLLGCLPFAPAQAGSLVERQYWMTLKAATVAERTAIASQVSIESVSADTVLALGYADDVEKFRQAGLLVSHSEVSALDFPEEDEKFHNYAEMTAALNAMVRDYPQWASLSSIGKSVEGRDLWMITLGEDRANPALPGIFFVGGHHAREHISIEMPLLLAQELLRQADAGNADILRLLKSRIIYIVPMLNVDGAEYDIATGQYRMWRKNRRRNSDGTYGADLNRNYDHEFGTVGVSRNPRSDIYPGPHGFSEPETRAVRDFLTAHTHITIVQSYHTFSELILYPWGYTDDRIANAQDYKTHVKMSQDMAKWNGYTVQQSSELYLTSGDTCDWAYGKLGIICFTFELDPRSLMDGGFYPGQAAIDVVFRKNWEPALYLIKHAASPYAVLEPASAAYGVPTLGW